MRVRLRDWTPSKIQEYSKKNDISSGRGSCTTLQNDPITQLQKTKEVLHNFFQSAKKEMMIMYQEVVSQMSSIGSRIKQNKKTSQQLLQQLGDIRKQAEVVMPQLSSKLLSVLVVPKYVKKAYLVINPEYDEYGYRIRKPQIKKIKSSSSLNKRNNSIISLDLGSQILAKKITQNSFKQLKNLQFLQGSWPNLQSIQLQGRLFTELCQFREVKADTLISLNLSNNNVHELSCFKRAKFPVLRQLNMSKNKIKQIDGLEQANFPQLTILNLSRNNITKLNALAKCKFENLLELQLDYNRIQQIQILDQCNFPLLQILSLDYNRIQNASPFADCKFFLLKMLTFSHNALTSIQFTRGLCLRRLQGLIGNHNKIQSLDPLADATFPTIKEIVLNNNQISDVACVRRMIFPELIGFDLQYNKIEPDTVGCFSGVDKNIKEAKKKFPFILI